MPGKPIELWRPGRRDAVRARALTFVLAGAPLVAACGAGGGVCGPDVVVHDSAEVLIVTHPTDAAPPEWVAEVDGRLSLPGEFFQVPGSVAFPDGSFMVADGGSRTLHRFGPDGEPLGAVGGRGRGPASSRGSTWRCRIQGTRSSSST